jgi:hypothetical protein
MTNPACWRGILVPSNQAEYLPEIPEREPRETVIRELMLGDVLPRMQKESARAVVGLNVQWALGTVKREPGGIELTELSALHHRGQSNGHPSRP